MNENRTLHIVRIVLCALCLLVSSNQKLNAADDVTIEVRFNGDGPGAVLHTLSGIVGENILAIPTEGLNVGPNLMTVRVLDKEGNVSTSYSRMIYVVEETATEADSTTIEVIFNGEELHTLGGVIGENTILLPTDSLDMGPNLMNVRVKDSKGNFSTSYTRVLYVIEGATVSAAEYYIDVDPGEGNGSPIAVNGKSLMEFSVPTSELSIGLHTLWARVCSPDGKWSTPQSQTFMVTRNGVTLEWFVDADPGIGNGNLVEAEVGDNVIPISLSGVEPGAHLISFRCRTSDNKQSVTTSRMVYVLPPVTYDEISLEWFVDEDPGIGNGTLVRVGHGNNIVPINMEGIAPGAHLISFRCQTGDSQPSVTTSRLVYVTPEITVLAAEYFVDNDPGEGNATPLDMGQDGAMPITIDTHNLATGSHTLTVRVKVAEDMWLPIYANGFVITDQTGIGSVEMMKDVSIYRENNAITLVSHHVENGSKVRILTLDGIARYSAVWEDTQQPLVANLPATLKTLIVVVETKTGKRLVNHIR